MSRGKNKQQNKRRSKSGKNRTPISGHKISGGKLIPPFVSGFGGKMQTSSWMNDRLPEMLWATLVTASTTRDSALDHFRRILHFIGTHERKEELHDLTHSGIAKLDKALHTELIGFIVETTRLDSPFKSLCLFQNLPAREAWKQAIGDFEPDTEDLMQAVGSCLWHQSQEATDCRWLRLMALVIAGKFRVPSEMAKEWLGYPNEGDQRSVRPGIRAAEMAHNPLAPPDLSWPNAFWAEAWQHTPCILLSRHRDPEQVKTSLTRQAIQVFRSHLTDHWNRTHSTTTIDPRHDAVFGMTFYGLRILEEMLGIGIGTSILGRLGLRTLLEIRINLQYLITTDSPDLWKKWREHGAGQAKLNALKFDDLLEPPAYINIETIEHIASEDIWEEFLTVNLSSWSGMDLRKLSEKTGLKDTYDQHYSWTSGFAHGMWGPVRESCYQTCGNPLHRLHRYPEDQLLNDSVEDAALLLDEIAQNLGLAYPPFDYRLTKPVS
jgi:hypothetical protein